MIPVLRISRRKWIILALGVSVAGAFFAAVLLYYHIEGFSGGGILASVCGGQGGSCDKVLKSRWSVFPPRPADAAGAPGDSLPVAALGLFYFSVLAVWFGAVGVPSKEKWYLHRGAQILCALSCLASLSFIVLMKVSVGEWCPLCLAFHFFNFTLLALLFLFPPRFPAPDFHPERRLLILSLILAFAVCTSEWYAYRAYASERRVSELKDVIEKHVKDPDLLALNYFRQGKLKIPVREDDPIIPALPGLRMTLVYFGDLDCPYCAKFSKFLFGKIKPLYAGHLRIVFKHFPLDRSCNPHSRSTLHRYGCFTARLLEAARLQGGSGAFWKVHDYLLANRGRYGRLNPTELAQRFNLDPVRFVKDMNSPAVRRRIREDCDLARRLGVRGTPAVFLNSRPVDRLMRDLLGFWKVVSRGILERHGIVR